VRRAIAEWYWRATVAPASALARLLSEPLDTRGAVARHPNASRQTLEILSRDVSPSIRADASRRLRELEDSKGGQFP